MSVVDVSVIIVNYNSSKLVLNVINSIFSKCIDVSFEIIIIDNNSPNDSLSELLLLNDPRLEIKLLPNNVGFGKANNEGLKIAKGRNIFFLNPDTLVLNDSLKILSDYLDFHEDVGACGGNLLDADLNPTRSFKRCYPSIQWLLGSSLFFNLPEIILYGKNRYFNNTGKEMSVSYIVGADLMVKREILDKVGLFDPAFFMYYEEIELCYRIRKYGYKIISVPTALIQHLEGKSMNNIELKAKFHYESAKAYYYLTHSYIYCFCTRIVLLFMILTRIFIFFIFRRSGLKYWKMQLYYYFQIG